jgi:hypothetical protein
MNTMLPEERSFEDLASSLEAGPGTDICAPSRLKSRVYSALIRRHQESGPLANLAATKAAGRSLCVFEDLVRISPVGEKGKSFNYCQVCHARVLAETLEKPPIYWKHCPYVGFQKG